MAVICPYCETENPDMAEVCKVCNESLEEDIDFEEPVRNLTKIATKIMNKEVPHTQEYLGGVFKGIMDSVQLIMDRTMLKLKENVKELKKTQEETRGELSDEDFESFQRFMGEFEETQNQINKGLHIARDSFFRAGSFDELEKGQLDLSAATAVMQEGLNRLESLTIETGDSELMTMTPLDIPDEIGIAAEILDEVLTNMNNFTETADRKYLIKTVSGLDEAKKYIIKVLDMTEDEMLDIAEKEEEYPIVVQSEEGFAGVGVIKALGTQQKTSLIDQTEDFSFMPPSVEEEDEEFDEEYEYEYEDEDIEENKEEKEKEKQKFQLRSMEDEFEVDKESMDFEETGYEGESSDVNIQSLEDKLTGMMEQIDE
ncbi:MAG: hypothetical protein K8T10_12450 [Candidatus Eremiobacteraeota bacterium]|nr:hypothetical protein [Candidatus Eremiobacteraeota bacterium]